MTEKLIGAMKALVYAIRFRKKIVFKGIPKFRKDVEIRVKQGKMVVGKGVSANSGAYFAVVNNGQLILHNHVYFGRNCITACQDTITIGDNVAIGPHVLIYDHDHRFDSRGIQNGYKTAPISIGNNCWIGAGTIILRGTNIGDGCIIGAGCVVKGNIPPHSLVTSGRDINIMPLKER